MTPSSAPGRPAHQSLRRIGLVGLALVLGACTATDESLLDPDREPSEEAISEDGSAVDDGTDSSDDIGGQINTDGTDEAGNEDLPFGDDGEEEVTPEPIEIEDLTELSAPEEKIAEVEAELPDDVAPGEVLDTIGPIDSDIELTTDRDGRTTNEAGELVGLDEPASLACANVEIALTALDEGDTTTAAEQVLSAGERAGSSQMASVQAWSGPLTEAITDGAVAEFAPLIGFISVCAEGGYEL